MRWSLTRSGRKGRFDCIPSHGLFTLLKTEFTERFQMLKETGNTIDTTCIEISNIVILEKDITFTSVGTITKIRPEEDPGVSRNSNVLGFISFFFRPPIHLSCVSQWDR